MEVIRRLGYPVTTITLGPLLLWQGRQVKKNTPRLPEAAGARSGEVGAGPDLRIFIVGDSSAAGVGVAHQTEALAGVVTSSLANDYCVRWRLVAETGKTTNALLKDLYALDADQYSVAITAVGVNDVTRRVPRGRWIDSQQRLWHLLRDRFGVERIIVSGLPPVHRFPALPQPLRWYLGRQANRFEEALIETVSSRTDSRFVSLRNLADTSDMASDGFHPGPSAYAAWGAEVARTIRCILSDET